MKYYRSEEEIPIWNLNKINETTDIRYLLKLEDYFELPKIGKEFEKMSKVYSDISEKLFEKFGFDERFINKMRDEKELLIMQLRILAGEKYLGAILKAKNKIKKEGQAVVKVKNQTFEEKVVLLETHFKMPFDVHKMSALKFYTYMDLYKRASK